MRESYYVTIFRCWHDLLSRLFLSAVATYALIVCLSYIGLVSPYEVLGITTAGLRYVGGPLVAYGAILGLPLAYGIFICNTFVALLIVSTLFLVMFYNPHRWPGYPRIIRRSFERDASAKRLRFLPGCRRIEHPRLIIVGFCLYFAPMLAMTFFGIMIGSMVAAGQFVFGSLQTVLGMIVPHGMFEVPAIVLAAAIPLSAHSLVAEDLTQGRVSRVFQNLQRFTASQHIQLCLTILVSALYVAGVIEAGLSA